MKMGNFRSFRKVNGIATLPFAIFLIGAITLVTILNARTSLFDLKIQTNEYQHELSFEAAEYGLEQGLAYLIYNYSMVDNASDPSGWMFGSPKWVPCSGTDVTLPCGDGQTAIYGAEILAYKNVNNLVNISGTSNSTFQIHYLTLNDSGLNKPINQPVVTVLAEGWADNLQAQSLTQQTVRTESLFLNLATAPIIANGHVLGTGNINLWGIHENSSILSIWAEDSVLPLQGSGATYDVSVPTGQYPDTTTVLSYDNVNGGDIVENDPLFPPDLFYYIFGIPKTNDTLLMSVAKVYSNCSNLDANSRGLIWIAGDCRLNNSNGTNIGSSDFPIMLIVSGELQLAGNINFYGGVFLKEASPGIRITGTINFHGFLAVDEDLDFGGGNVNVIANSNVFDNLNKNVSFFAYVHGSWIDSR